MINGYNGFVVKKLIMELLSLQEDVLFGSTNLFMSLHKHAKLNISFGLKNFKKSNLNVYLAFLINLKN